MASITKSQGIAAGQASADPRSGATLARVLDVNPVEGAELPTFRGAAATNESARMFGGHAMAQALLAAGRTVPGPRVPVSLHAVLLRPGDASVDCDLEVEVVRDGRSYATRRVVVTQAGRTIALVSTQWHAAEDCSLTFDDRDAEQLPPRLEAQPLPYPAPGVATTELDLRWSDDARGRALLFRTRDPLAEGRDIAPAIAIYVSDLWLSATALHRMGRRYDDPAVRASTLEHSVWLHRPVTLTSWSCLRSTTVAAQQGRALVTADLRTDDGAVLASITQAVSLRDRLPASSQNPQPARSAP